MSITQSVMATTVVGQYFTMSKAFQIYLMNVIRKEDS